MTDYTRYVNTASTAGGDGTTNATAGANRAYAGFSEAEAAGQALATVNGDTFTCYLDGAGGVDTVATGAAIAGWTDDVTIKFIQNPSGTAYELTASTAETIRFAENYITVNGFKASNSSSASSTLSANYGTFASGANKLVIEDMDVPGNTASSSARYDIDLSVANLVADVINTAGYSGGRGMDTRGAAAVAVSYCTFFRHADQLGIVGTAELTCKNTYSGRASGTQEDFWTGGAAPSGSNNASSDSSAQTDYTSSLASIAPGSVFTNITAGSEDFHLVTSTSLEGAGTPVAGITTDRDGDARDASTPDIGIDEVAGGGLTGSLSAATSMGAAFGAVATTYGSLSASLSFDLVVSAAAAAGASIVEGLSIGDSDGGGAAAIASVAEAQTLSDIELALAQAAAAISAGLVAGESWAVAAQATANISEGLTASAAFSATTAGAVSAAISAGTIASATFLAAVQSLAALTAGVDLADVISAQSATYGTIEAGISFGSTFSYPGAVGCVIAAVTIAVAVNADVELSEAVKGSTTIAASASGTITKCP